MFGSRLTTTEEVLSSTIHSFDKLSHLYKTIFDNIATGIITTNEQNIITSTNNAARTIIGFSSSELIGINLQVIFPAIRLRDNAIRQANDFIKKDGTIIRIGYSVTPLNMPRQRPLPATPVSLYEEDSKLITLQDISEVEKLERKIRQGEKLAAIGMMSASIAHDFRNPLTAISGSAQILAQEFSSLRSSDSSENLALTNIILRESNRLIATISDFLKFARPESADCQWFSLVTCIEEVLQVCRADPSWPSSSEIIIDMDPKTDIWADERQFFTVVNHLLQNAIAFCPPGQEKIVLRARELISAETGEALCLSIEDNGRGIEEFQKDKIFEPFYTSRTDGTGLGLAIVKQTVEIHKGNIEVSRSELGGAKFTLTLPLI
jgi:two-component system sensor histidine kinase PilS (NtrC family)